jgi:hypothetical protein
MLRQVRPRDHAYKTLRSLAVDLVAEIRQLDRRITKAANDIEAAVESSGSTLSALCGIGTLNATKSWPASVRSIGSVQQRRSPPTPAPHLSRHLPVTSPGITCLAPVTASSTVVCTPWPSPRSLATPQDVITTGENVPPARATEKRCAVSNDASPTPFTDNSCATRRHQKGQARRHTRGRL